MNHYAENTGRHCMAVLIDSALKKRLDMVDIPEKSAKRKNKATILFGLNCIVVDNQGAIEIDGMHKDVWARVGITEAQAKEVMMAHGTGVLKKCSWSELWRAYKKQA